MSPETSPLSRPEENREIASLKRKIRLLAWLVAISLAASLVSILKPALIGGGEPGPSVPARAVGPAPEDGILRVRGISVVDENGTERVRIGAPIVEPLVLGKRIPRGGKMSGILLFDDEGNERSGYVTSDGYPNVFFTLDSLKQQHVLFIAEPQGDTTLRIWNGGNAFNLSVGDEEAGLKLSQSGKPIWEIPAAKPAAPGGAR